MLSIEEINVIKRQIANELLPIGVIMIFPYKCAPDGFIPCDGRSLNKQEFKNLYELIGDIFGADATTFRIPDLRGKFVRGYDNSGIYDCNHPFGEYQEDAFQGHSHRTEWGELTVNGNGTHNHSLYGDSRSNIETSSGSISGGLLSSQYKDFTTGNRTSSDGWHTHTLPEIILGDVCSNKYGKVRVSTETRPKNISLNFCIKAI